ncbi:hypothetical protein C5167_047472 [Papaver somniferum]|uniref:Ubiquitin-like domain-containing protein n=1 Tax=Papaver somniferum TaxID=3469 RepID=A0A4Y7LKI7_PAPSO|nr:hypothetical protein C5167_047472 [Papaver somniferum]
MELLQIRLPKQSTVGDAINDLKTKVECPIPARSSGCWKYSIIRSTRDYAIGDEACCHNLTHSRIPRVNR